MTLSILWDTSPIWAPAVFIGWQNPSRRTARTFRAPTATTEPGSWPRQAFSICSRPCTPMKRREVAKHDLARVGNVCGVRANRADRREAHSPASLGDFCSGNFGCLRVSRPSSAQGAGEVHFVDSVAVSAGRRWHRLGNVSFLALNFRSVATAFLRQALSGSALRIGRKNLILAYDSFGLSLAKSVV